MILANCSAVKELREVADEGAGAGAVSGAGPGGLPGSDPERGRGVAGGVGMVDNGGTGRGDWRVRNGNRTRRAEAERLRSSLDSGELELGGVSPRVM